MKLLLRKRLSVYLATALGGIELKKYLILIVIMLMIITAGCGNVKNSAEIIDDEQETESVDETKTGETEDTKNLKLQILKGDEGEGVTIESNSLYSELDKVIQQNQNIGAANDFSVYVVDTYSDDEGNSKLVLLGINRLPVAIKNFTFTYTLGSKDHEYVWEKQPVEMKEETAGVLQPNSAIPIVLTITDDQVETLRSLETGNTVMSIDDFTYEEVE